MPIRKTFGCGVVAMAAALLAGCSTSPPPAAQAAAGEARQCFLASQVNGFHAVDEDTVHVFVGASRVYELDVLGTCPSIDWTAKVGIRSTGGGSWICRGHDAELVVPSATGFDQCPVLGVRQLTPEEGRLARGRRD